MEAIADTIASQNVCYICCNGTRALNIKLLENKNVSLSW